MNRFQKVTGLAAITAALTYVVAFIFFGAFWAYPAKGSIVEKMTYLANHQFAFSAINFLMYVVFGIVLAIVVIGLHEKLKSTLNPIEKIGTVFGVVWVALVMASGMLATIGLSHSLSLMELSVEKAFDMWRIFAVLIECLGGGNELVGGLWVLSVSAAALTSKELPNGLIYLGIIVGACGIATAYPAEVITEIFGITQIFWFIWLGVALLRQTNIEQATHT